MNLSDAAAVKLGGTDASAVYLGATKIWPLVQNDYGVEIWIEMADEAAQAPNTCFIYVDGTATKEFWLGAENPNNLPRFIDARADAYILSFTDLAVSPVHVTVGMTAAQIAAAIIAAWNNQPMGGPGNPVSSVRALIPVFWIRGVHPVDIPKSTQATLAQLVVISNDKRAAPDWTQAWGARDFGDIAVYDRDPQTQAFVRATAWEQKFLHLVGWTPPGLPTPDRFRIAPSNADLLGTNQIYRYQSVNIQLLDTTGAPMVGVPISITYPPGFQWVGAGGVVTTGFPSAVRGTNLPVSAIQQMPAAHTGDYVVTFSATDARLPAPITGTFTLHTG